jgi:hypothetical protein
VAALKNARARAAAREKRERAWAASLAKTLLGAVAREPHDAENLTTNLLQYALDRGRHLERERRRAEDRRARR